MKKERKANIEATKFFVEQNEQGLSKTKIAELFGANRKAITKLETTYQDYINSVRDIDKDYMFLFEPQELQACEEFKNDISATKISIRQKYNIGNSHTLDNWLEILGISTERHYKYNYNRATFAEEPTEKMAYWLGFLLADGYITKHTINVGLGAKDKEHIYKLAKFIGYSEEEIAQTISERVGGAYTKDNKCYHISINSVDMVRDLNKYNILPQKSMKEQPYHFETPQLQLAYIRGIIDGDGWVSNPLAKGDKRFGVVGSKEVCEYIKTILSDYTDAFLPEVKIKQASKDKQNYLYYWQTTNKQATQDLLKVLYPEDCPIYLDRKYKNAIALYKSQD